MIALPIQVWPGYRRPHDGLWFLDQSKGPCSLYHGDLVDSCIAEDWQRLGRKPRYVVQVRGRQVAS